jgi:hypothetical protein
MDLATKADGRVGTNMIVSFDVVSLYPRVPIWEAADPPAQCFEEDIMALFCLVFTCSYYTFCNLFYEQTYRMVNGSLLFPMITNFYMVDSRREH